MASILVIDDDDLVRELVATTLAHAGYTVYQAADGRQGVDTFHAVNADLVLTDIIMPGQEGIETIMQLRHQRPTLPIVAMSGGATRSKFYLDIAAKLGARNVLAKPFTPQELVRTIAAALTAAAPPLPAPPSSA